MHSSNPWAVFAPRISITLLNDSNDFLIFLFTFERRKNHNFDVDDKMHIVSATSCVFRNVCFDKMPYAKLFGIANRKCTFKQINLFKIFAISHSINAQCSCEVLHRFGNGCIVNCKRNYGVYCRSCIGRSIYQLQSVANRQKIKMNS